MTPKARPGILLILSALFLTLAASAPADETESLTTVILVRHAEKMLGVDDPPLAREGRERARRLAYALGGLAIDTIYSTPTRRTRQTAEPLAQALGLEVVDTPLVETYVEDMAKRLKDEKHAGGVVVVIGHSNTTPEITRALGVDAVPDVPESDHDNLFVVVWTKSSRPRLLALRF